MKRTIASLGVLLAVGISSQATAALIVHEPYDYPADSDLSGANGGTGWASAWASNLATDQTNSTGDTVGAGSLNYTDTAGNRLATSGNRGVYAGTATGGTSQTFRRLPAVRGAEGAADNTTTWVSFVGQRLGPKSGDPPSYQRGVNLSLYNSTLGASQEQLAIGEATGRAEDTWSLVPEGSGNNTQASSTPFDQLSLVVVRIDHKAGFDDAYLFLNPTLGSEPALSSAAAQSLGAHDFSFDTLRPFAGGSQSGGAIAAGEIQLDEIRVGDAYGDVTPFIPVPEPTGVGVVSLALMAASGRTLGRKRAR